VIAIAAALVSGGSSADPRTPPALPGGPPPFLGTAVLGDGGASAAVDSYGDLVDLRPSPAGPALLAVSSARQVAGTVAADSGVVPRLSVHGGPPLPPWRAAGIAQRYLPGTNVLRTVVRFGRARLRVTQAVAGARLAVIVRALGPDGFQLEPALAGRLPRAAACEREALRRIVAMVCEPPAAGGGGLPAATSGIAGRGAEPDDPAGEILARARATLRRAAAADRRWLRRALPLGEGAPQWTVGFYRRSLLVLHALTARRSGAVAAGARDGWAYVWPRDAGTAAIALRAAGYRRLSRRVSRFLLSLDLGAAARFDGSGGPVPDRAAQGDAAGWAAAAAVATGLHAPRSTWPSCRFASNSDRQRQLGGCGWRGAADYWEGVPGDYLANAVAGSRPPGDVSELSGHQWPKNSDTSLREAFGISRGLVRRAGDPGSGLDSAAAWAVRPFALRALYGSARRTMLRLERGGGRFGITPGEAWKGADPWSAPTAWTAWSLAALARSQRQPAAARADRRAALRLLADLRRAATPLGTLPERVGARSGLPRSTTPLAWSHAFAILALRQLWPE